MTQAERLLALREAGMVERAHTTPHIGSYNIAAHSWQAVMIILVYHPAPSLGLIATMLTHDVPERWTGDTPAPAKWASKTLTDALRQIEQVIEQKLGINYELTAEERKWVSFADRIELMLWSRDQQAMGNRHVERCIEELVNWFRLNWGDAPTELRDLVRTLKPENWKRSAERI